MDSLANLHGTCGVARGLVLFEIQASNVKLQANIVKQLTRLVFLIARQCLVITSIKRSPRV